MSSPNGFQNVINSQPGVAEAGDFADANVRASVIAGPGQFVAAPFPRSPKVGNFGFFDQAALLAYGAFYGEVTAKVGFIHREQNAVIVAFLAGQTMTIDKGLPVTGFDQGSFWALFAAGAVVGQKVFANFLDGSVYAAAAGTSTQKATSSAASLASSGVLTIGGSLTGTFAVGQNVTGAGGLNTTILSQLSGTAGAAGTYQTSQTGATIGSEAVVAKDSVETGFSVDSPANAGELAKISTWG